MASSKTQRHVGMDAVRRLWRLYLLFPLLGVWLAGLFLLPVNEKDARQMLQHLLDIRAENVAMVPLNLSLVAPLFGLLAALLVSQMEKPVYRMYATLPMSRAERGRRIWLRQAVIAPGLVLAPAVALLGYCVAADAEPVRVFMFAAVVRVSLAGMMLPALILLVSRRPVSEPGLKVLSSCIVLVVTLVLAHYVLVAHYGGTPAAAILWLGLAALTGLVLGASYARAPLLAAMAPAPAPAARRYRLTQPNSPQSFTRLVFTHALVLPRAYAVVLFLAFLLRLLYARHDAGRAFQFAAMDAMLAGTLVFAVFQAAGRFAAEQARLLRALPLSPTRIAIAVFGYAFLGSLLLMPLAAIVQVMLVSGRSPLLMAGAILFAADAGCLAVVIYVRASRWASQSNLLLTSAFTLTLLALSFEVTAAPIVIRPDFTLAALAAFPICLAAGFFGLRQVLARAGAYAYRDYFVETFTPQP